MLNSCLSRRGRNPCSKGQSRLIFPACDCPITGDTAPFTLCCASMICMIRSCSVSPAWWMKLTPCRMSCWSQLQLVWTSSARVFAWSVRVIWSPWNEDGSCMRPSMRSSPVNQPRRKEAAQEKKRRKAWHSQCKKKENLTYEMDYPRACQGRPRGLSLAHQEVCGQGRRVFVRADRPGDGGRFPRRSHALRRERRGTGASRQGVLV